MDPMDRGALPISRPVSLAPSADAYFFFNRVNRKNVMRALPSRHCNARGGRPVGVRTKLFEFCSGLLDEVMSIIGEALGERCEDAVGWSSAPPQGSKELRQCRAPNEYVAEWRLAIWNRI
jgi:hypothetical protein